MKKLPTSLLGDMGHIFNYFTVTMVTKVIKFPLRNLTQGPRLNGCEGCNYTCQFWQIGACICQISNFILPCFMIDFYTVIFHFIFHPSIEMYHEDLVTLYTPHFLTNTNDVYLPMLKVHLCPGIYCSYK